MVGLEIHFQLRGKKLFCSCGTESLGTVTGEFNRKLSPTVSEMGHFDPAAQYEKARARKFLYRATDNSCLVEADEEPPHSPNADAVETAMMVAHALNCSNVESVMFMRKLVVDGSNTSGFQRTAVVGLNGHMETSRGMVRISSICIEEDSARKSDEEHGEMVAYTLDRLGVPLLEIATEPDIKDGQHAVEVARSIGQIVGSTGRARREVDSIRQDVNISLGFGRVEMKGIQKLSLIGDSISHEIQRQTAMGKTVEEIRKRGGFVSPFNFTDVTASFRKTDSRMLKKALDKGESVYCSVGSNLSGLLKNGDHRLGKDLSDICKAYGLGGIMHTDEMPAFGIGLDDIKKAASSFKATKKDAILLLIAPPSRIELVNGALNERMKKLMNKDFSETRGPNEDGTTRFLRPLPGSDRMYPETDVPVVRISPETLDRASSFVPKTQDEIAQEIAGKYGISLQDAGTIASNGETDMLALFAESSGNGKIAARIMLQTIPELEKKHGRKHDPASVSELLSLSARKKWSRTTLEAALEAVVSESFTPDEAAKRAESLSLDDRQLRDIVEEVISEHGKEIKPGLLIAEIKKRTDRSFDPKAAIGFLQNL